MDSFGIKLKREREKRKISLDDVSAATKISNRFLSAIETDRFDQLPGGIFNRGFIRAYASHLGLDEEQTVADYLAASGEDDPNAPVEPEHAQQAWAEEHSSQVSLPWKELAAVLLLAVVGVAYWKFRQREGEHSPSASVSAPANPVAFQAGAGASPQADNASRTTPTAVASPPPGHPGGVTNTNKEPTSASSSQVFHLRIVAREDSWISISGPQGEILRQVLTPPEEKNFTTRNPIVVRVGNVGGLDFIWNGRALPSQGKEGEVKTLIFDGAGVHIPPPPSSAVSP